MNDEREKQHINQIMKKHEPWMVGVSTHKYATNLFYPVYYSRKTKSWHGYYDYRHPQFAEHIPAVRRGNLRKYYVNDTTGIPLPADSPIHNYIESVRNAKKSKKKTRKKSGNNS